MSLGLLQVESRAIDYEELVNLGCNVSSRTCKTAPPWVYSTSYWTSSDAFNSQLWFVSSNGSFDYNYYLSEIYGVRPVVTISKEYF